MSFDFNYKFWITTANDIKSLIERQNIIKNKEPIVDRLVTFQILSQFYVLHTEVVSKLGYLYKVTRQIQKRNVIRNLIEPFVRRLIDLKNELKKTELSEYVYLDKTLITRKLLPHDLIIWRSPHFLYRRPPEIEEIIFENSLLNTDMVKKVTEDKQKAIMQAVKKIQSYERARQARVYKSLLNYNKKTLKKNINYSFTHKSDQILSIPIKRTKFNTAFFKPNEGCSHCIQTHNMDLVIIESEDKNLSKEQEKSARTIQTAWRRYKAHKIYKKERYFKQSLYGMRKKGKLVNPKKYKDLITEIYKNGCFVRKLDDDYIKLITDENTRILQELKPQIMEDISDHIRAWFREFYDKTGDFHPYPDALKSGTVMVLIDKSMNLEEFKEYKNKQDLSKEERKSLNEKLRMQKLKEKENVKKQKLKEASRRKKLSDVGVFDIGYALRKSNDIDRIEKTMSQFSSDWKNVDEYLNKQNKVIAEWITESELAKIHQELRILVDEYMRIEYELLKKAWSVDNKKKYKPSAKKKIKKFRQKKIKGNCDLIVNRTIASFYEELKYAGIIENYPKQYFADFIGEFSFIADDARNEQQMTTSSPSKSDIKMVIQDNLFGMGEFNVEKPKSLCLIGPSNNGKKMLCNVIASEIDALFINLSPERTHPFSNNLKYFIHVVMKVAKSFQPTIIFIEGAHRIFWEKVPKDQRDLNPTLLKDVLMKNILKSIKKSDRIMVVGTSDIPWNANAKFKKTFQNILLVPKSNYGTLFLLWLDLMTQNQNINHDTFDDSTLSALAKVFETYNTGDIINCVTNTLNIERRLLMYSRALQPNEFLEYFICRPDPIFPPEEKDYKKYENWFNKINKFSKIKMNLLKNEAHKNKKT